MSDPLGAAASAVTIADRLTAVGRWLVNKLTGRPHLPASPPLVRHPQYGLELVPLNFEVSFNTQVPVVVVTMYAINYTAKEMLLVSANAQLYLSGGPSLDNIPLVAEFTLPRESSRIVACRRNLADSEARAIAASASSPSLGASLALIARGQQRRREIKYGPVAAVAITGSTQGRFVVPGRD